VSETPSPNTCIAWYKLLPLIGVHSDAGQLPVYVTCPHCSGHNLGIYQDNILGGSWHYCSDCGAFGDMLELASTVWQLDIYETLLRLERSGIEFPGNIITQNGIALYKKNFTDPQQRAHQLKNDSSHTLAHGLDVNFIQNKLGLNSNLNASIWRERMGQFIGAVDRVKASETFRCSLKGNGRLFKGDKWGNVLTVPFQDMSGRICGFMFIGRNAEIEDIIYRPVYASWKNKNASDTIIEAGVCMAAVLHSDVAHSRDFKNNIFVTVNPFDALRIQNRHMRDASLPLPIVGSYHGIHATTRGTQNFNVATQNVWDHFQDKNFIFWTHKPTAAAFNMASMSNGRVCILKGRKDLFWRSGKQWLQTLQEQSKPWRVALEHVIEKTNEKELQDFLQQLRIPTQRYREFVKTCSPRLRERIEHASGVKLNKKVFVNNKSVTQNENGWWDDKTGSQISNAVIRIEHILYRELDDTTFYKGVIVFKGNLLPFCANAEDIENNTFKWMQKRLIAEKKEIMTSASNWSRYAIEIAMQLHSPSVQHGVGRFGWQPENAKFCFPKFAITCDGDVIEEDSFVIDELAPGTDLTVPSELAIPNMRDLTVDTEVSQIFWATVACIAANIVAPALNRKRANIGLMGDGAVLIGRIAASEIGCRAYNVSKTQYGIELATVIKKVVGRHNWPLILVVQKGRSRVRMAGWLNYECAENIIIDVDRYIADALGLSGDWRFIINSSPLMGASAIKEHGRKIIPLWLQDFCQRKMQLRSSDASLAIQVLEDIAEWAGTDGDAHVIHKAKEVIDDVQENEQDKAIRFVEMLYRYINEGAVTIEQHGFDENASVNITFFDKYVFVPRSTINKLLANKNVPILDTIEITTLLTDSGGLEDSDFEYNNKAGWLIRKAWWDIQYRQCHTHQNRLLRIVGGDE